GEESEAREETARGRVPGTSDDRRVIDQFTDPHDRDAVSHAGRVKARLQIAAPADLFAEGRQRPEAAKDWEVRDHVRGDLRSGRPMAAARTPMCEPQTRRDRVRR